MPNSLLAASPYIVLNLMLIWIFFELVGRRFFSRPHWLLTAGLTFMAIGASEKYLLQLLKPIMSRLGDIDPAVFFVEVSVAALGGNLVASAFLMKAEESHRKWESDQLRTLSKNQEFLSRLEKALSHHFAQEQYMEPAEYEKKLDRILDAIERRSENIDKLKDRLNMDHRHK